MSTNFHTPWEDGETQYTATDMNAPLSQLDQAITNLHSLKYYDYGGQFLGETPHPGMLLMRALMPRSLTILAGDGRSQFKAGTAATGESVFTIKKNDTSIGTITVAASGTVGSVSISSDMSFVKGDILRLVAPDPADSTLKDISWTIVLVDNSNVMTTTSTTTTSTTTTTAAGTTTTTTTIA